MEIKISNLSSVPIYQQVATQIKSDILNGSLKYNDQLPSIRSLAKELEVGIITVKKSYEVLLQEDLIYSKGAVGYFVNDIDIDTVLTIKKEEYLDELKSIIDKAINEMKNWKLEIDDTPGVTVENIVVLAKGVRLGDVETTIHPVTVEKELNPVTFKETVSPVKTVTPQNKKVLPNTGESNSSLVQAAGLGLGVVGLIGLAGATKKKED